MSFWVVGLVAVILGGGVIAGPIMSNVEQAKYDVLETHGFIEIRTYAPMIAAETRVSGVREDAINEGFRVIADYIFGNNIAAEKIAMTSPVIQQAQDQKKAEKIAMTAPVLQQEQKDGQSWNVQFIMPSAYTIETLPKPQSDKVVIRQIPEKYFAVIRFSGLAGKESLAKNTQQLEAFIASSSLKTVGKEPIYAFFNPPWTAPFLRRNEIMIEIERPTSF